MGGQAAGRIFNFLPMEDSPNRNLSTVGKWVGGLLLFVYIGLVIGAAVGGRASWL